MKEQTIKEILKGIQYYKSLSGGGTTHYGKEGWSTKGFLRKFVNCTISTSVEGNECYFFNFGIEYSREEVWDKSGNSRSPFDYFKAEAGNRGWVKAKVDEAAAKDGGLKENGYYNLWYLYDVMSSDYKKFDNMDSWKKFVLSIFPSYVFDDEETLKEKKRIREEYTAMKSFVYDGSNENDTSKAAIANGMIEMARQFKAKYGESITV